MTKLSPEQIKELKCEFSEYLGTFIKKKRMRKNFSRKTLSEKLQISERTLIRYEEGNTMPADLLLLISFFCEFPMTDYFSLSSDPVKTFNKLIERCVKPASAFSPYAHSGYAKPNNIDTETIGVGEKETVSSKPKKKWDLPKFQAHLDVSDVQPFTERELRVYFMQKKNESKRQLLKTVDTLAENSNNRLLQSKLKYIADWFLEDCLNDPDLYDQKRLVAYFRLLCKKYDPDHWYEYYEAYEKEYFGSSDYND